MDAYRRTSNVIDEGVIGDNGKVMILQRPDPAVPGQEKRYALCPVLCREAGMISTVLKKKRDMELPVYL